MADRASPPRAAADPAEIAGNRLELIESGEERFRLLLELIAGARAASRC